ncbi:autotransporter outer membrane beta-barrel domain-containing protein [Fusobacterium varium]
MIEKIIKAVKSSNKKRSRNITIGAVIGFLLSCTAVMGTDNYLWIKEDGGEIKFSTNSTTGDNGKWDTANPYSDNNWDTVKKTYTNNMKLSSNTANGSSGAIGMSYGLRLSGDLTGVNFINNNSITGEMSGATHNYGYGIHNLAEMENIENRGIISGTGDTFGYGIFNSATMRNIENKGTISGVGSNTSGNGYGIENRSTIEDITNAGLISGYGESSGTGTGSGICNSGTMGKIENAGLISGTGNSTSDAGTGSGICNSGTMGKIENAGLISGTGNSTSDAGTGSGIYNDSDDKEMGAITNTGVISGSGNGSGNSSPGKGYGIYNKSGTMGDITNIGIISGYGKGNGSGSSGSGYGINNESGTMGAVTNTGVISGYGDTSGSSGSGINNNSDKMGAITNIGVISGYGINGDSLSKNYDCGINNKSGTMGAITNTGVIYGKDSAIKNDSGTIGTVDNYGILATQGSSIIEGTIGTKKNYGLYIGENGEITVGTEKLGDEPIKVVVGYDKDGKEITTSMTIKNATLNEDKSETVSFVLEGESGEYDNSILNGKDKTLKVSEGNNKLKDSIINAYGTAVVMEGTKSSLVLNNTVVNGGAAKDEEVAAIEIGGKSNTLTLKGESIVNTGAKDNVAITVGGENNVLVLEGNVKVNGEMKSTGNNTLSLNGNAEDGMNMLHNITGFVNMNIDNNVTFFEDVEVTGAEKITIEENGTLTLRIDSTNKDNLSGKIIGHALYENEGEISSTDGGKLLLALNGAGNQSIISFGDTKLNTSLVTAYEGEYYEDVTFGTTSLIHSVKRVNDTENEVEITVKKNLPLKALKYEKLNKIYHGILSVEDLIANFNVDSDEKLSIFLGYLNDIYAGNPYSYSSELSRKSVGMFRDIAVESQFKPELNKWLIMGGLTHVDGGTKDTYYGKGYYTYDIGSSDMDADTKITGAYMLGEYGVSDTLAYGVVIGGNKLKSDLSNGSKVDGDALYMGAYAKKYIGNLKVTGGLGLQYGDYDADRIAINKVASSLAEPVMKYCDNYNDMTYDIYLNGRYSHNIGNNLFLEPYGTLSYTYIKQDSADEGSKVLAIETDSKSFDYTAAKVGVDLKKVIPHEKGKSTLSAGVSYTRLLTGADEENITGRFKGENSTDFDILVAHKNEHSIGLNAKYALELESGILFDVKGSYSVERDSHNGTGKNRTKGGWIVGAGIGYKF